MNDSLPNVAVVILDTLRYDAFKRHFDWIPGKRFSHAFSTSHHSIPSHASLFTGQYPSEIGVHVKSPALDCNQPTLAERLRRVGYATYGFHENGHLESWDNWDRGFDRFTNDCEHPTHSDTFDWEEFGQKNDLSGPLDYCSGIYQCMIEDVNTYASLLNGWRRFRDADFLRVRTKSIPYDSPTFLFINLIDAHQPYSAPDEYFSFDEPIEVHNLDTYCDTGHDESKICKAYHEGVAYLSDRYERIFRVLEDRFEYIITTADHGELLGEHGGWTHGPGIYPEITHVPLVISGAGIPDTTCDAPVSLLDVHATVCEITGIAHDSRGQDIRHQVDFEPRLTEYHGTQPWQYSTFLERGIPEKFHEHDVTLDGIVGDGFYGYETKTGFKMIGESPWEDPQEKLKKMRESIPRKQRDESWLSVEDKVENELHEDTREKLSKLGYI